MVMGCPFEGEISPLKVAEVSERLYQAGCYEVSLGDTVGVGTEEKTAALFDAIKYIPKDKLAAHFHDTYDRAIPNILVALEKGISVVQLLDWEVALMQRNKLEMFVLKMWFIL